MKLFIAIVCLLISLTVEAQFIGIGNKTPAHILDVSGRMRIRGGGSTAGLWLTGLGIDSTVDRSFIGMATDSTMGFFANGYSWSFIHNFRSGFTGIDNQNPSYPLSFKNSSGAKISLFDNENGGFYGFSTGFNSMIFNVPDYFGSFQFGTGKEENFNELMRFNGLGLLGIGSTNPYLAGLTVDKKVGAVHAVMGSNTTGLSLESDYPGIGFNSYYNATRKAIQNGFGGYIGVNPVSGGMVFGVSPTSTAAHQNMIVPTSMSIAANGNVGIGVSDPAFKLDAGGRIRVRAETSNTAGIWFNNAANSTLPAFVGMQTDQQVGFYGTGTGWSFTMNTATGAIGFGGNTGQPGQILTSNGNAGAPQWKANPGAIQLAYCTSSTPYINDSMVPIPGLTANITLNQSAPVLFNFRVHIFGNICFGCVGDQEASLVLCQEIGSALVPVSYTKVSALAFGTKQGISGPIYLNLPSGSYTFKLFLLVEEQQQSFSAGEYSGIAIDALTWQIL